MTDMVKDMLADAHDYLRIGQRDNALLMLRCAAFWAAAKQSQPPQDDAPRPIKMKPLAGGTLLPLAEFIKSAEAGTKNGCGFIDYDGFGKYATATEVSNIEVFPSQAASGEIDHSWPYVVWYNR